MSSSRARDAGWLWTAGPVVPGLRRSPAAISVRRCDAGRPRGLFGIHPARLLRACLGGRPDVAVAAVGALAGAWQRTGWTTSIPGARTGSGVPVVCGDGVGGSAHATVCRELRTDRAARAGISLYGLAGGRPGLVRTDGPARRPAAVCLRCARKRV